MTILSKDVVFFKEDKTFFKNPSKNDSKAVSMEAIIQLLSPKEMGQERIENKGSKEA